MVDIQNADIINKIAEDTLISPQITIPKVLGDKIQLVLISNPRKKGFIVTSIATATGAASIKSIPSDKHDYFLVSIQMTTTFSALCDSVKTFIRGSLADTGEVNLEIFSLVYNAGTVGGANQFHKEIIFPIPIKISNGTAIDIVPTFAAGTQTVISTLTMYKVPKQ